jgi:hypothetical protein
MDGPSTSVSVSLDPEAFEADDPVHAVQLRESKFATRRHPGCARAALHRRTGRRHPLPPGISRPTAAPRIPTRLSSTAAESRCATSRHRIVDMWVNPHRDRGRHIGEASAGRPEGYGPELRSFAPIDAVFEPSRTDPFGMRGPWARRPALVPRPVDTSSDAATSPRRSGSPRRSFTVRSGGIRLPREYVRLPFRPPTALRLLSPSALASRPDLPPTGTLRSQGPPAPGQRRNRVPSPRRSRGHRRPARPGRLLRSRFSDYCAIPLPAVARRTDRRIHPATFDEAGTVPSATHAHRKQRRPPIG